MKPYWKPLTLTLALAALGLTMTACGSGNQSSEAAKAEQAEQASPEEKKFAAAAEPFVKAVAARDYAAAYAQLSSHARSRMSLNQFSPDTNDTAYARNESQPRSNVSAEDFAKWMTAVEAGHGQPSSVRQIHVFETDPKVLSGQGERLEVMFAIGAMPASVPADIRRASVRCQIKTTLSPDQLKQAATDLGTTPTELQKDPDFEPYFNLKVVLVEEEGALRIGYFEFLPPSILD